MTLRRPISQPKNKAAERPKYSLILRDLLLILPALVFAAVGLILTARIEMWVAW